MAKGFQVSILGTNVICKETGRYIGWPTITRTRGGELIVVFSGDRDLHICPWGKTELVRSPDMGKTWTAPVTIRNTPLDDRDAGIIETLSGTLLVSWFTSLAFERKPEYVNHAKTLTPEVREKWLGNWVHRSEDGGNTWTEPVRTHVTAPHGPIHTKDGRLIYLGNLEVEGELSVAAEASHDEGRNWEVMGIVPLTDHLRLNELCEPHLVEIPDGRLIGMFRSEAPDLNQRFLYQSESSDGGRTWAEPWMTPIWGYPPHLIRLTNGWLIVAYGRRIPPYGERACISRDDGATWDTENEITISDAPNGDLGYPASAELEDGSILTVYYQIDRPVEKPCLMGTRWRIDRDS